MTTKREAARFLEQLRKQRPEMALVGRIAILPPIRHFLRYILVDRTSSASICEINRIVQPLYVPAGFIIANLSTRIWPPHDFQWRVHDPADAAEFAKIAGPFLELIGAVDTPQAFIELEWADHPLHHVSRDFLEFPHRLFDGDLGRALELLQAPDWLTKRQWQPVLEGLGLWDALRERGSAIPGEKKRLLAEWFRDRERRSVAALNIGHLWEDTPLPPDTV